MNDISRVIRTKEDCRKYYNSLGKWYDLLSGSFEKKYRNIGINNLDVRSGDRVLEIGFATGKALCVFANLVGSHGKVFGLDISDKMLEITDRALRRKGISDRVELKCGDASNLPYSTDYFDKVFISFTLELFDTPEIPFVLDECRRVMKDNGHICIITMSKKGKNTIMLRLYEWFHEHFEKYVDCRPIYLENILVQNKFLPETIIFKKPLGLPIEIITAKKTNNL
jgi:demethylmenaquinone methyltransferase/2-methoxy-6-polyprenyl-1,4-benzoquinol methylase